MGGKDGSPGGGTFTPLRIAVASGEVAGFLGSMFGAYAWAVQFPWLIPLAMPVPFLVVFGSVKAGDALIEWHERRTETGVYEL